ncbi:unnamed protein product [Strongylus vulgaris]|uniref:Fibronectin type-III domain-containing protein n=1 Tax=Strongylus vulgaris TaxID=40348 RepID=A0A3P7IT02_STRVU|nr:unnamed protein product [Strongylus vulgaris]
MGYYDESQWITASVESDTLLKIKGLIPGVQYRFKVTAVGPSGRLGEAVDSTWTEISSTGASRTPTSSITIRNGYNSDRGVTAHVEWSRTPQDSCYYKLQLSNSTLTTNNDITLDASSSILLPHLEFDCDYTVTIAATTSDRMPEPVTDLSIYVYANGTGFISWNPSADPENILFYQLIFNALSQDNGCQFQQETINIQASASSAFVDFPGHRCEYVIRLVNYDLIGRDAVAETRVVIEPARIPLTLEDMLRPEILLTAACFLLFFILCILIRCKIGRKCPHRVSEKQQKLREYA